MSTAAQQDQVVNGVNATRLVNALCAYVQQTSAVLDIIRHPVPVSIRRAA